MSTDRQVLTDELGFLVGHRTILESRITALNAQLATADPCGGGGGGGGGTPPIVTPPVGTPLPPIAQGQSQKTILPVAYYAPLLKSASGADMMLQIIITNQGWGTLFDVAFSLTPGDFSNPTPPLGAGESGGGFAGYKNTFYYPISVFPEGSTVYVNVRPNAANQTNPAAVMFSWNIVSYP